VAKVEVERGVSQQPVGEGRGTVPGAVAAALEEQDPQPGRKAPDLLAGDVGTQFSVEVVERFDRFVQIAAVPEALDDLSPGLEEGFLSAAK